MSFVADSYDVYAFTEFCTAPDSRIRKLVESRPHQKLILRPDSGEPIEILSKMLNIIEDNDVVNMDTLNDSVLFRDFGILWGDGITPETIEHILKTFTKENWAAENFLFGSGGDLMQNVTRDTQKFAIKCSSITVEIPGNAMTGSPSYLQDIDVFKDPITDPGKASMKGKVTTYYDTVRKKFTHGTTDCRTTDEIEVLETIFKNGKTYNKYTLDEFRARSAQ